MNIAITGGGTGGHLAIAKAIKDELNAKDIKPIFVGSQGGQDKAWFEHDDGFAKKIFLPSGGVVNKRGIAKLAALFGVLKNTMKCVKLIKQEGIDVVFSVGGYSAAPLVLASVLTHTKLYIHEQNAVQGALNKLTAPYAKAVFSSFSDTSPLKDYPVQNRCFELSRTRDELKTIIFLGGSQGAAKINELALALAPALKAKGISIIHQAGAKSCDEVAAKYKEMGIEADVFGFSKELQDKIAISDFAVARSGAGTLFELAAHRLPAFFIPYPYAAGNHQEFNAKYLSDKGAAFYKNQSEVTADDILKLIENKERIFSASKAMQDIIGQGGAKQIVDFVFRG